MFSSKHNYVLKRTMIAVLAVSMILIALPAMTYASGIDYNYNVLTLSSSSRGVTSITVSGGTVDVEATPSVSGKTFTYNITLSESTPTSDMSVTATFVASSTDCVISTVKPKGLFNSTKRRYVREHASLTHTATIAAGTSTGTVTAYVYPDLDSSVSDYDTYVFNYTCSGTNNPKTLSNGALARLGDPAYPLTEPEEYMQIGDPSSNVHVVSYSNVSRPGYYPDMVALYVESGATVQSDSTGITVSTGGTSGVYTGYTVNLQGLSSGTGRVKVIKSGVISYLEFSAPSQQTPSSAGTPPTSVVSYLPIGQFATGSGWGSSAGKFVQDSQGHPASVPETTGVSLGAFGGYIEFYFEDGIPNSNINDYGVDFMIYGNAFNGNPEAGSVQVSDDGKNWYELAGSKYYEDGFALTGNTTSGGTGSSKLYTGTRRNSKVTWTKGAGDTNPDVALYQATGNTAIASFSQFGQLVRYPEKINGTTGYYPMSGAHDNTGNMNISYNPDSSYTLTFPGITAIEDSDNNGEYGYGYCDITPNGSPAKYGTAVNPYEVYTSNKKGGDGFDLEWITDIATGEPVDLDDEENIGVIRYVRVYSSVLHNAGVFGETSAEVTGIFLTTNTENKSSVGRTDLPSVSIGNTNITDLINTSSSQVQTVNNTKIVTLNKSDYAVHTEDASGNVITQGSAITVGGTNLNVFINNDASSSSEYMGTDFVRIVAQNGYKAPYIILLKFISNGTN